MMWNPAVPSPKTVTTRALGRANRAAMANGIDAPIAPAGPLMIRVDAVITACAHCPHSPPSQTNTESAAPARYARTDSAASTERSGSPSAAFIPCQDGGR